MTYSKRIQKSGYTDCISLRIGYVRARGLKRIRVSKRIRDAYSCVSTRILKAASNTARYGQDTYQNTILDTFDNVFHPNPITISPTP